MTASSTVLIPRRSNVKKIRNHSLRVIRPSLVEVHPGRPQQRKSAPVNEGPRTSAPRLRDGAWFSGGGTRRAVLDEVLDFLSDGEERYETDIRRALR